MVGGKGSELVGLHMNAVLVGQSFIVARSWLILGGKIPLQSAKLHLLKHQIQKIENVIIISWLHVSLLSSKLLF